MTGWPDGWRGLSEPGGARERFVGPGDRYVLYGEREGCRRAAWAIEGGAAVAVGREALAKALQTAFGGAGASTPWGDLSEDTRQGYLAEADEAIRLLCFEPCVGRAELRARIEELEQRNARLTTTANAAVARAEEAQLQAERAEKNRLATESAVDNPEQALSVQGATVYVASTDEKHLRAEVRRLRRALDAMARGVAHMATAVSEMVGSEEGAP